MSALKRIWNIFTTLLVIAVVILAIALVGVRLVGLQPFTVLSGSMEPTYHTGSLIYVKTVDYRELKVGDPITFMLSEDMVATHRIVEIVPDEEEPETLRYRTKGDANEHEDGGLVHYKNIIGTPIFSIPKLGYVANYVQTPPGTYYALVIAAFAILLMFLPELIKTIFSEEDTKENENIREKKNPVKNEVLLRNDPSPKFDMLEEMFRQKDTETGTKQKKAKPFKVSLPTRKKGRHEL